MTTVSLPDGHVAELRDPAAVTTRQRRPFDQARLQYSQVMIAVENQVAGDKDDPEVKKQREQVMLTEAAKDPGKLDEFNDKLILVLLDSWDYPFAPSEDSILDVPGPSYTALLKACQELVPQLSPDFEPTADPKALTNTSPASDETGKDADVTIPPSSPSNN